MKEKRGRRREGGKKGKLTAAVGEGEVGKEGRDERKGKGEEATWL